jgi:hypothetical protein
LEVSNLDFYDYLCGIIFMTKNSTENFEQEKKAIELPATRVPPPGLAGQTAFDAYNAVHGKPPPSEALDHIEKAEQLDKTKMIEN